jgi:hypothetical protein
MKTDINSVYVNFWGKDKPKFTELELAIMEGGHSLESKPIVPSKLQFIKDLNSIKHSPKSLD